VVLLLAVPLACGEGRSTSAPSAAKTPTESASAAKTPTESQEDSNERQLTRAQSLHLVSWAQTFRSCMVSRGAPLGPLEKSTTHIKMELPDSVTFKDVQADTEACAERQGGPPRKSSLQYRPGEIIFYLPKQCLLDAKIAAS
jgi:hypothetical protein